MSVLDDIAVTDQKNAESAVLAAYICGQCAEDLGGKWPKGHRAKFVPATCPICGAGRPIAAWHEWNWPKAPKFDSYAKQLRE